MTTAPRAGRMGRIGLPVLYLMASLVSTAVVLRRPESDRWADLGVYWGAARAVAQGHPLYDFAATNGDPFTYPPAALALFRLFATLPFGMAGWWWTAPQPSWWASQPRR